MARLSTNKTLDTLVRIIADLEARAEELKQVANTLALDQGFDVLYADVTTLRPPPARSVDMNGGPVADSQD
jgi:hypothetical protein